MAYTKGYNLLFDIINALFNNKEFINSLTPAAIKSNYFMMNQRLAIKYPLQAQVFNNMNVNVFDVLYFWRDYLYNGSIPPMWIYEKGKTKSTAAVSKSAISNKEIKMFCEHFDISRKDYDMAMKLFPKDMTKEINEYLKFLKNAESSI